MGTHWVGGVSAILLRGHLSTVPPFPPPQQAFSISQGNVRVLLSCLGTVLPKVNSQQRAVEDSVQETK